MKLRLNKKTGRWGSRARDASASAVRRFSVFALICLMAGAMVVVSLPPGRAAGAGQFDHVVILAMENQDYSSVLGSAQVLHLHLSCRVCFRIVRLFPITTVMEKASAVAQPPAIRRFHQVGHGGFLTGLAAAVFRRRVYSTS